MEAPIKTRYDKAGPQVAEALRRRHFEAHYVSTAQEALELALQALAGLSDGNRLVGIISHVAELKERIPAQLIVTGGVMGSHASFRV